MTVPGRSNPGASSSTWWRSTPPPWPTVRVEEADRAGPDPRQQPGEVGIESVAPAGPGVSVAQLAPRGLDADRGEVVAQGEVVGVVLLSGATDQAHRGRAGRRLAGRVHAGHEPGHLAPVLEARLLR